VGAVEGEAGAEDDDGEDQGEVEDEDDAEPTGEHARIIY